MSQTATVTAPVRMEDVGIRSTLLVDLALKALFLTGEMTLRDLANHMHLTYSVVEQLYQKLRKDQLCEVTGMTIGIHHIQTTSQGKARAAELLNLNQYAGPAPVSLSQYVARVHAQSITGVQIHRENMKAGFAHMVLEDEILDRLGTAMISGQAIFLYGPTGTGKTSIGEAIGNVFSERDVLVPYAVEIDGQIITVFDPLTYKVSPEPLGVDDDQRWVRCGRPRVIVGGELTVEMLDLQFNPVAKFYSAPIQMKANNGVLIVDDFGRQRLSPEELLNRWIVPLDRRVDYLTLVGGKKIEIPFDLFVVFSTNLDPHQLADEAFLRRIQTKVKIDNVTPQQFKHIFRRVCERNSVDYKEAAAQRVIDLLEQEWKQPLRPCVPRDLVNQICWTARFQGRAPELTDEAIAEACRNYFVSD